MKFKHELIIRLLRIVLSLSEVTEFIITLSYSIIELFIFPFLNHDNDDSNDIAFIFTKFRQTYGNANLSLYLEIKELEEIYIEHYKSKDKIKIKYNLHNLSVKDIVMIITVGIGFFVILYLLRKI